MVPHLPGPPRLSGTERNHVGRLVTFVRSGGQPQMDIFPSSPSQDALAKHDEHVSEKAVKQVFISWASNCSRSDSIARHLGGTSYMVYYPFWGSRYATIVFKYACQIAMTLRILFREKPSCVIVMTPPVASCFA